MLDLLSALQTSLEKRGSDPIDLIFREEVQPCSLVSQANDEISLWITLLFTLYYKTRIGKTEAINLLLLVKEFSNKAIKVKADDDESRLPQHTFELLITYLSIYDPNPGNCGLDLRQQIPRPEDWRVCLHLLDQGFFVP